MTVSTQAPWKWPRTSAVTFVTLLLAVAVAEGANPRTVRDREDVPGPLDIASAKVRAAKSPVQLSSGKRSKRRHVIFTVRTVDPWSADVLSQKATQPNYVGVQWGREKAAARCIEVTQDPALGLVGTLRKVCRPIPTRESTYPAGKPDGRTVRILVRRSELERARWWRAVTSYEAAGDPDCPVPEYTPPEQLYGACVDTTSWTRLRL